MDQPPIPPATISPMAILDALPSAILMVDGEDQVIFVNPAAELLLQSSANLLTGHPLQQSLAPHSQLVASIAEARRQTASVSEYGIVLALRRGQNIMLDTHIVSMPEPRDHCLIVLQRCSVAQTLDQQQPPRGSNKAIAGLAKTLAHEVKNPISGIRGAAQLLEPYIGDEDQPLVQLICDEADRICKLVDQMDAFGAQATIKREAVNIHQVLEHVRRIAENGFGRHVIFHERYDPSLPEVLGDRDQLIQVFLNLIKNAAEAVRKENGQITLITRYQHGLRIGLGNSQEKIDLPITVDVLDNGPGVSDDMTATLFEPFVSSKPKGSGLGLPLVAKLIDDQGGMVSYLDEEQGALFRVRLPAVRARNVPGRA